MGIKWLAIAAALGLSLGAANLWAWKENGKGLGKAYGRTVMIGMSVRNPQGQDLGKIRDVVIDAQGKAALAVLSPGGASEAGEKPVAVPFEVLTLGRKDRHLLLDASREQLNSAPAFRAGDLSRESYALDVYRHFGRQPYWTPAVERTAGEGMTPSPFTPILMREPFPLGGEGLGQASG